MVNDVVKFLNEKKDELQKSLIESAASSKPNISDIAKEYGLISKMLGMVPSEKKETTKTKRSTAAKRRSSKTSQKKDENAVAVTMTDDLTGKRPIAFNFMGKTYDVNSFRSLSESLCRVLYEHDKQNFVNLENIPSVNGDKHKYFSKEKSDVMSDPVLIGDGNDAIYVDIAKLSVNNLFFLKRVCSAMGIDPNKIPIYIDSNYVRKERTKKS